MNKSALLSFILSVLIVSSTTVAQTHTVTINVNHKFQVIEGFGTCVTDFHSTPEMAEYWDDSLLDMAVYDLGLSMIRFSFPQSMEWENDNENPDIFNWDSFNMQQLSKRMRLAKAFQDRGVKKVFVSTWSPPEFTKTHKSAIYGGHLRMDMYDEYAENFGAMIIAAKQNWGVNVGAIGLQNELLFIEPYKSCIYNPFQAREAVRALQRKFQKEGISAKIIMPEEMMAVDRMKAYVTPTLEDKETYRFNGAFGSHRLQEGDRLVEWADYVAPSGKQSWMTETSGHATSWQGALELAEDIQQYLVLGHFSAWMYWQLSGGKTDVYALMDQHTPLPKYYTSKHFYKFIRPGAIRVEASTTGKLSVSAFIHPVSGQMTVVLVNNQPEATTVEIVTSLSQKGELKGYVSTENQYFKEITYSSEKKLNVPAKSVITLISEHEALKTKEAIEEWPEAWLPSPFYGNQFLGKDVGQPGSSIDYACALAERGNLEELKKELVDKDINAPTYNGWTLLHHACLSGEGEIIEYLLANGANVNQTANDGWTPVHMAASTYVNNSNDRSATKTDILKMILEAKPNIDVITREGFTALHAAAMNAHTAYNQKVEDVTNRIELLVKTGIPVDVKDKNGRTPLHWAAWQGSETLVTITSVVVDQLIRLGASVDTQDSFGNTPLIYATSMGYLPIVASLLSHNAHPDIVNNEGESAIAIARIRSDQTLLNMLLDGNQKSNIAAQPSKAPSGTGKLGKELLQAAWNGDKALVLKLLKRGADTSYRDSDGFSAIDRARDSGHQNIVKILSSQEQE